MKAEEKVMITDITSAIELTVSPAWQQPKRVIEAIEKSAQKLIKNRKKVNKHRITSNHKTLSC